MIRVAIYSYICFLLWFFCILGTVDKKNEMNEILKDYMAKAKRANVKKKVLSNGLAVLALESRTIPKVSMQLWFNVGSKDEESKEKGIAHLIEHMVFKGTQKLSETDIIAITHRLSGTCNAFTWYDYTGYLFNMPEQHWKEMLPVIADCMTNCTFKDDHLNSELKAVIQEMKLNKDNFFSTLFLEMMGTIFPNHPYHYSTLGNKHDLYRVRGKDLLAFYKKHYLPNNATLVVVGAIDTEEVFALAEKYFGGIKSSPDYKKEKFYLDQDISAKSVSLYRGIKQPIAIVSFLVPGMREKKEHVLDAAEFILSSGKSSRLYSKLVDDLQLATSIGSYPVRLFDRSLFLIWFEPKDPKDIAKIGSLIVDEINKIVECGITKDELARAGKKAQMEYFSKLESIENQAFEIGLYFLATGDENYALDYLKNFDKSLEGDIRQLFSDYFRQSVMHTGAILPLTVKDEKKWQELQNVSDQEDEMILSTRVRKTLLEQPRYANNINIKDPEVFNFPKSKRLTLSNGVKVLYHDNNKTPKINLLLDFRAKYFYDLDNMQGLYNFVTNMMIESTKNYTAEELAGEIENRGMSLTVSPGYIFMSMLSEDLEKGLDLLEEILSRALFKKNEIEKVRMQLLSDIKIFWDSPLQFSGQLIKEQIYKGHPYSKNILGTQESIKEIQQKDLISFYNKYISPSGAKIALVGDLSGYNLKEILEKKFSKWSGPEVVEKEFPKLSSIKDQEIDYYINRDQVVLCLANLSIDRMHEDYDKLILFDEIFCGGSMHSRLFQLREKTGLFYSILGSLTANSGKQPGMIIIKTLLSLDKLKEAEKEIKRTIDNTIGMISESEFEEAKRALINAVMNQFESNNKIAQSFLFLEEYGFSANYFDKRAKQLSKITLAQVNESVKKVLRSDNLLTLRVGRVGRQQVV